MRLVRVVSRTFEAVVLLEAGRVEIIVATRVNLPLLSSTSSSSVSACRE
jgi:hypothetical protein